MINNDVLVTGVQQSDSVIPIQVSILFQFLFPFKLLQNIEPSSLCYTVGPYRLSILNIVVCTCQSHGFHNFKLANSLKFICKPPNQSSCTLQSFTDMQRAAKKLSHQRHTFPAEVNKVTFCLILSALIQ